MGLTARVTDAWKALTRADPWPTLTWNDYVELLSFNGNAYLTGGWNQTIKGHEENIDGSYASLAQLAYKTNGIVYACMLARSQLFSEARFQFQELRKGRPGSLFSSPALDILEHPWPNGVTGDLLKRAIQDHDLAGNAFLTRSQGSIRRLRPDWVTIVLGSTKDPDIEAGDVDAEVLGYIYHPGGRADPRPAVGLLREQVAHFMAEPDPLAWYRGMSWLTPVMREISADKQMTEHKSQFLLNGGTPNIVVSLDKDMQASQNPAAFLEWIETFKKTNPTNGWEKFRTMYLAGGTKMEVVGSTLQQIDFKAVQGAGETRIAAAAGVPPVIVGLSEGLQAATYSNYGQARRRFADNTMRPLWRNLAGSLETLVPPPNGSRLWYDDRDIQALAEDKKDLAEVRQFESTQIKTLIDAGFEAATVVDSVLTGDWGRLSHTGLFSVQLQAPGSTKMPVGEAPGELPVGGGTAPLTPKLGAGKPAGPAGTPSNPGRSEELMVAFLRGMEHARQEPTQLTIAEGAVQVTVEAAPTPNITFEEGAIRGGDTHIATPDVNVTVEPAQVNIEPTQVTIEDGAIRVDSPVTVEPTQVTIADGAVRMTVEPAQVTIAEGAVQTTVEPPQVVISERAITLVDQKPMRTRLEFAADGKTVIGEIEERAE